MRTPLRVILPSVMGVVSLPLVVWDIYDQHVIASMGMAWDTGALIWPYETPDILLRLLNAPAYWIAVPIANILRLSSPDRYVVVFPSILLWWSIVSRVDHGRVIASRRWRWPALLILGVVVALMLWAATSVSIASLAWLIKYPGAFNGLTALLMMTRLLTPALWCVCFALMAAGAARRVAAKAS